MPKTFAEEVLPQIFVDEIDTSEHVYFAQNRLAVLLVKQSGHHQVIALSPEAEEKLYRALRDRQQTRGMSERAKAMYLASMRAHEEHPEEAESLPREI